MTETMDTCPEGWEEIYQVMSNFDHEIDAKIAERLKSGNLFSSYPGWNFYATVWWSDGNYHAEVKCYCIHQTTLVSDSLQEIMNEASTRWGSA